MLVKKLLEQNYNIWHSQTNPDHRMYWICQTKFMP